MRLGAGKVTESTVVYVPYMLAYTTATICIVYYLNHLLLGIGTIHINMGTNIKGVVSYYAKYADIPHSNIRNVCNMDAVCRPYSSHMPICRQIGAARTRQPNTYTHTHTFIDDQ